MKEIKIQLVKINKIQVFSIATLLPFRNGSKKSNNEIDNNLKINFSQNLMKKMTMKKMSLRF